MAEFVAIKPQLPTAITNDQAFLRLIIERLDLTNALLIDILSDLSRLNNNIIDVESMIKAAKTVSVNFDVEKLAERLNLQREIAETPAAFEDTEFKNLATGSTVRLKRAGKTAK